MVAILLLVCTLLTPAIALLVCTLLTPAIALQLYRYRSPMHQITYRLFFVWVQN